MKSYRPIWLLERRGGKIGLKRTEEGVLAADVFIVTDATRSTDDF